MRLRKEVAELGRVLVNFPIHIFLPVNTLLQPGAADKQDYGGARAAASSGLSWVRMVGGVVGMLGV